MIWWQKLKRFKSSNNKNLSVKKPSIKRATPVLLTGILLGCGLIYAENYLREGIVTLAPIKVATYSDDLSASLNNETAKETNELLFTLNNTENETKHSNSPIQKDKEDATKLKSPISLLFDQALLLSRQDKQPDAIKVYQKIIKLKPNHQMATINLAILLKKSGKYPEAIKTLEHALSISGGTRKGKIYALLGSCHEALKQHNKAIQLYQHSIEFRPSHALTWRRLARQSSLAKRPFNEVLETYNRAIALNPEHTAIYLEKAQYQFTTLDFEGVINTLSNKQLPKLNQSEHRLIKNRLRLLAYTELGRFNKARQHAKVFQKNLPKNASNQDLTLIAIATKRYRHARHLLASTQSQKPALTENAYLKAKILQLLGSQAQANTLWNALLKDQTYSFLAQLNVAKTLAKNEQRQQALTVFTELLSKANYTADIAYKMSLLSIDLNQELPARRYAKLALSMHPKRRKYQLLKAEIDHQFGKLYAALTELEVLSERYPKSRTVLRQWAKTLESAKQYPEAIEKYRLITASNQKKNDLFSLAKLLIKTNDIEASSAVLESLLEKYNDHIEARYLLAENLCLSRLQTQCHYQAGLVLKLDKTHSGAKRLMSTTQTVKQQG